MKTRGLAFCLAVHFLFVGFAFADEQHISMQEVMGLPPLGDGQRIYCGPDSLPFGDLRIPDGNGPFPVAIVVHGGCWASPVGLHIMDRVAANLTEAGLATWNIEYRRIGDEDGGWPGTFKDVALAADYVRKLAAEYPLDLKRVIAVGHSSGGHLALWLSARHRIPEESDLYTETPIPLNGAACLGGVPDLRRVLPRVESDCGANVIELLLGGSPESFPDRYQSASPVELLPIGVNQLVVCGADDTYIPPADGIAYQETAEESGDLVEYLELSGAGHFELIAPWWKDWGVIKNRVLALVDDWASNNPKGD